MATPDPEPLLSTTSTAKDQRLRMSYEGYCAWAGEDVHAEWVNGEVIVQMPPKPRHQQIVSFLTQLLGLFTQLFRLGQIFPALLGMRATPDGPARQPDLLFVAHENLDRITEERLNGPADLVVEVISDDSVARDRADKFYEYQAAGVREYWILDPRPGYERTDFYVLDEKARYRAVPVDPDGRYHSTVLPGFWLQVDWVLSAPPDVLNALGQVIGPERLVEAIRAGGIVSSAEGASQEP